MVRLCSLLAGQVVLQGLVCVEAKYQLDDLKRSKDFPPALPDKELNHGRYSIPYVKDLIQMSGKNYKDIFCGKSKDNCETVENFPGPSFSHLKYDAIIKELATIPERELTGEIRKRGDLGYFIFNNYLWNTNNPLDDWKQFPIGARLEDHAMHRPIADELWGEEAAERNRPMIREMMTQYINNVVNITDKGDGSIDNLINKILHKMAFDYDMPDAEATKFGSYKGASLISSIIPGYALKIFFNSFVAPIAKAFLGADKLPSTDALQKQREGWLALYEREISAIARSGKGDLAGIYEGYTQLAPRDRRFLADLILTAHTSAGGLSIPTVISLILGTVYGDDETSPWKVPKREITKGNIKQLIYETIRRYPAVVGYPYWHSGKHATEKRTVLNLAMALRDEKEWGETEEFRLRDLEQYEEDRGGHPRISIAWGEHAQGPHGLTENSRGCPARTLSVVLVEEFLSALEPVQGDFKPDGVKKMEIAEGPSKVSYLNLVHTKKAKEEL